MTGLAGFKRVCWMLIAVCALASAGLSAQQDKTSQGQSVQTSTDQPKAEQAKAADQPEAEQPKAVDQPKAEQPKADEPLGQAEVAQAQGEASQEQTESAQADTEAAGATPPKDKVISGMSILGNQEAPKSLVIVPWKSSQIGAAVGISTVLDDSRQPIDKDVFMRALSYYEIKSEKK